MKPKPESPRKFKAGQTVWYCSDTWRNVYEPYVVTVVVARSYWFTTQHGVGFKVSHKLAEKKYLTDLEKHGELFIKERRYKIAAAVEKCKDADVLRRIAEIVNYRIED